MAKNPVAANLLMLGLLLGGAFSAFNVQQEVFPEFTLDYVTISVPFPGATPTESEDVVTSIEQNISGLDGVKQIGATASEGRASVVVELMTGADPQVVLADVKNAVDRITTIPASAERPIVNLMQSRREVISLVYFGDLDEATLKGLVEDAEDRLKLEPGITLVETAGIRQSEISIEIRQDRLREYGLSIEEVATRLRASALEIPAGGIKTTGGEILVRTRTKPKYGSDFKAIPIATTASGTQITLGDIAVVKDAFADVDQDTTFNGKPAAMVKVYRVGNETPVSVAIAVKNWVGKRQSELPKGVGLALWNDQSELFKDRMSLLTNNAALSFVLVLFVLGLFIEMRLAFWVTLGIPISVLGSFVILGGTDVSINMVSMFAFIVTLGIVVDDAIIVSENIWAKREAGMPPLRAAIEGVKEVAVPVTFSVLTTVAAFVPMFFVPGVSGKIFAAIPAVVVSVLFMSLIESFFILPAHLGHGGEKRELWKHMRLWAVVFAVVGLVAGGASGGSPLLGFLAGAFLGGTIPILFTAVTLVMTFLRGHVSRAFDWLTHTLYAPLIRAALKARYLTAALSIGVMAISLVQCPSGRLRFSQMPRVESDLVSVTATLPFGSAMADSERISAALVAAARAALESRGSEEKLSRGIFAQIGGSMPVMGPVNLGGNSGSNIIMVQVLLVASDLRDFGGLDFTTTWREKAGALAGVDTVSFRGAIAMGGSPIDVKFIGDDMKAIEGAASDFAEKVASFDGVKDINPGFQRGKPQVEFSLTRLGEAAGLSIADVGRQVRNAYFGAEVVRQQRGTDELKVMIRLPETARRTEYSLENLMLRTPSGGEIQFTDAVTTDRSYAYTSISRQDGRRAISVTADVDLAVTTGDEVYRGLLGAGGTIQAVLDRHAGVSFELSGERKDQNESNSSLMMNGIFALFIIYALIAMAFRSWLKPVAVLFVVPMAAGWAFIAHLLLGYDLSIISMMGIVALAGVAVNDSIVLIDAASVFIREEKMSAFEAASAAGVRRFRPIWLTSLTTFLGLAPMIFETSMQARFLVPMAISLGFGVLFATVSTLLSIPALYLILEDVKHLFGMGPSIHAQRTAKDEGWGDDDDGPGDTREVQGVSDQRGPGGHNAGDFARTPV